MVLKNTVLFFACKTGSLSSESVQGTSLALEGIHDIHSGDGLSASVLGVGDGVTDNVLEEGSQDEAGLVVDERGDSLDTTASGESADSRLGDSGNVISQDLAVTLGSSLAQSFSSFSSSRHSKQQTTISNPLNALFLFFLVLAPKDKTLSVPSSCFAAA